MRLHDGFEVYWRSPGASQVGLDPRCSVLLEELSDGEQRVLEALGREIDRAALLTLANAHSVRTVDVDAMLERLRTAGVLREDDEQSAGSGADPDARYWRAAEVAGIEGPGPRVDRVVQVCGVDQLGLRVAGILAQAGVGSVLLQDRSRVRPEDVGAGMFRPGDVGVNRAEVGRSVLRAADPKVRVSVPPGTRPDLVVVVEHGVVDPVPLRALMREDVAHLPVLVRELDVVVGPLVRPGLGVCLRCVDLYRCEADPRWPAVATQVAARPPAGVETSLGWSGAAVAAGQVLAVLDGRPAAVEGAGVELTAWDPVPVVRTWQVHPECGCSPAALSAPSGGSTRPARGSTRPTGSARGGHR
ncbi:hypothetical protein EXU48_04775 [Occultella glacieicola]|uniref:THIF-type NAD/FAD binding fold domain-containing protein n=1 Tax=Occultella glacieicola TaxID=2518684 RepID=A0ABY2E7T8_9MICO|nr:hypothetical protein [Occultella glacieicola]TDE97503.1 hypothetical protein EXU48_04775 [Occultella glacieicola]